MDLDQVPVGTAVYQNGLWLGILTIHHECNGNRAARPRRQIQTGKWADRFAYRGSAVYRAAKAAGPVQVRVCGN